MNRADGVLLLLGSGVRHYREYLLAGLARRPLWLFDDAPIDWQLRYVAGYRRLPQLVAARLGSNPAALVRHAEALAAQRTVVGVLTYDDTLVMAAARLAERLGLPGLGVPAAQDCRDKHRTRCRLTGAGLAQPRFAKVGAEDQARQAAARIGYPVVVKPAGMGGSLGVVRADAPDEMAAAFATASLAGQRGDPRYNTGVLVEEFLEGPEISVDGAVAAGEYRPMFVARKTVGLAPFFEETAHVVDAADPLLADVALLDMLRRAHRALGLRDGMTHTEVMLTARGPVIVEVNPRLGGDLIPALGQWAIGIDPADVAADVATGGPGQWQARPRGAAGIRFCYPPADGVVREVRLPRPGDLPGLVCAVPTAPPGTVLRLPPRGYLSRCAFVACTAPDATACTRALADAAARVTVDLELT